MAIKSGTVINSINQESNELRRERNSNVSRSLRKWREDHPNAFIEPVYTNFSMPKKQ